MQSIKKPPGKLLGKKSFLEIVDREIGKADKPRFEKVEHHLFKSVHSVADLSPAGRVKLMQHVWKEAEKKGFIFNVHHYNSTLKSLVFLRLPFEPLDLLKSMEGKGIELNKYTYQLLIQKYAHQGDSEMIRKLLWHHGSETINQENHGWLMHAYIRNGDAESADNVEEFLMRKVDPDISLYSPVINVHAELGNLKGVQNTIAKMAERGIQPVTYDVTGWYVSILDCLAIGNHRHLIDSVLDNMEDVAVVADHFEPLIRRCLIRGDYSTASKLLSRVDRERERLQMYEDRIKNHIAYRSAKKHRTGSGVSSQRKPDS